MQMQIKDDQIVEFQECHQQAVENLVLPIQQIEFGVPITREEQADLIDVQGVFQKGKGNFWVAIRDGQVVGTIGVVDIGSGQVALKKMFVHRDYRGKQHGISAALMNGAKEWCRRQSVTQIFLGTTAQMSAAHKFYERNGFVPVDVLQLPAAFPLVHVDSKFYRCDLNS